MKRTLLLGLILFLSLGTVAFAQQYCQAAFEYEPIEDWGIAYFDYSYTQQAPNDVIQSWLWEFDNGQISTEQNPVTFYASPADWHYTCLTIVTAANCTSTYCDTIWVDGQTGIDTTVLPVDCSAEFAFEYSNQEPYYLGFFAFYDADQYNWSIFGPINDTIIDGTQYEDYEDVPAGTYTVCLDIVAGDCYDSWCQLIAFGPNNPTDTTGTNTDCYSVLEGLSPYPQDDPIFQEVIANDPWCCDSGWDQLCQSAYDAILNPGDTTTVPIDTICSAEFAFEYTSQEPYYLGFFAFYDADQYNWSIFGPINDTIWDGNQYEDFEDVPAGTYLVCLDLVAGDCYDSSCQEITLGGNVEPTDCSAEFELNYIYDNQTGLYDVYLYPYQFEFETYYNLYINEELAEGITFTPNGTSFLLDYGQYDICLEAAYDSCYDVQCQTLILDAPSDSIYCNADFGYEYGYDPNLGGYAVYLYPYNDLSPNNYDWNVDVMYTPNANSPYFVVETVGTYEVCLTLATATCQVSNCEVIVIESDTINNPVCETILNESSPYGEDNALFQTVIAQDSYCCDVFWDGICQQAYNELAGITDSLPNTDPNECLTVANGSSPYGSDDAIFQQVIEQDPWCCNVGWDALCDCQYNELAGVTVGDTTIFVEQICGEVFAGSPNISEQVSGTVYLIAFDPVNTTLMALQTYEFEAGDPSFCFDVSEELLAQPILFLKAALNEGSPYYEVMLPTYYNDALLWSMAQPVTPNQGYTIYLTPGVNPGGPGFIEGEISAGAGKAENDMANIPVLLLDEDRNPVAYVMTDENGEYDFGDLPYGTYQVIPDVMGQRIAPIFVTISEAAPSASNVSFEIETVEEEESNTGILNLSNDWTSVQAVPNPTQDFFELRLTSEQNQTAQVALYNMVGQLLALENISLNPGTNAIQQNIADKATGIYFLEVILEDGSKYAAKVVKE